MPPPSVSPPTPVWLTSPAGHGQPVGLGGGVHVAQQRAAADRGPAGDRVDPDVAEQAQVDHQAAVTDGRTRRIVRAAAHDTSSPRSPAYVTAAATSAAEMHRAITAGTPVDPAVPHPPPLVEARVAGLDHRPFHHRAELTDRICGRLRHNHSPS
jgi:hypothetical protein